MLVGMVAAMLLTVGLVGPAGGAGTTQLPVAAQVVGAGGDGLGSERLTGHVPASMVLHIGDMQTVEYLAGSPYLAGAWATTIDFRVHLNCGSPESPCQAVGGSFKVTFDANLDEFDGGWRGTATAHLTSRDTSSGFTYAGTTVGFGYGALEGWRLRVKTWTTSAHDKYYEGLVFAPGE